MPNTYIEYVDSCSSKITVCIVTYKTSQNIITNCPISVPWTINQEAKRNKQISHQRSNCFQNPQKNHSQDCSPYILSHPLHTISHSFNLPHKTWMQKMMRLWSFATSSQYLFLACLKLWPWPQNSCRLPKTSATTYHHWSATENPRQPNYGHYKCTMLQSISFTK